MSEELKDVIYVYHGNANKRLAGKHISALDSDDERVKDLDLYYERFGSVVIHDECSIDFWMKKEKNNDEERAGEPQTKETEEEGQEW